MTLSPEFSYLNQALQSDETQLCFVGDVNIMGIYLNPEIARQVSMQYPLSALNRGEIEDAKLAYLDDAVVFEDPNDTGFKNKITLTDQEKNERLAAHATSTKKKKKGSAWCVDEDLENLDKDYKDDASPWPEGFGWTPTATFTALANLL